MKKISINFLVNVMLLLAGVLFVALCNMPDILKYVSMTIGILFAIPSLIYLLVSSLRKSEAGRNVVLLGVFPAVGGLCFGIVMVSTPELFVNVLSMMLGVLLCILGVYHILYLILSLKRFKVMLWHFVCPLIVTACGCAVLFTGMQEDAIVLTTGISLILFNISSLLEYLSERSVSKKGDESEYHDEGALPPSKVEDGHED